MKRIARLAGDAFGATTPPVEHAELTRILKQHLPPTTVALFAWPKAVEGGVVEWYSELGGQPVPLDQLPPGEADQVRRLLNERIDSIQQLANRLESRGGEGVQQAALLRQAARYPASGAVYSLNGQPVLTFWGQGAPALAVGAATAVPPEATPDAGVDGAAGLPPTAVVESGRKRRRWWPWLLLTLLLLGLLAALLWWLFCREEEPVPPPQQPPAIEQPEEPQAEEPEEPKIPEEPEEPAEEPEPEPLPPVEPEPEPAPPPDPLDELADRISATRDCAALHKIQLEEPLLKGNTPKAAAVKQQVADKLAAQCKDYLIKQAKNLCPDQRPTELAPELVIVFDASGSMDYSINASREEIERIERMLSGMGGGGVAGQVLGALAGMAAYEQLRREPKRITAARQATAALVGQVPRDVNIGMVLIERCPSARNAGYFAPAQRGNLLSLIQNIRPAEGTPLADAVSRAGQMLDGVNRESVMVVVSDGEESCNQQDPCAVARTLAASKPHLKINVVDIMGTGAGHCLAKATGGQVFTARNVNELTLMTNQAARDVLGPEGCRP